MKPRDNFLEKPDDELTENEKILLRVYKAIIDFKETHQKSPTIRELAKLTNKSTFAVKKNLLVLDNIGIIQYNENTHAGIVVVGYGFYEDSYVKNLEKFKKEHSEEK